MSDPVWVRVSLIKLVSSFLNISSPIRVVLQVKMFYLVVKVLEYQHILAVDGL